MVMSFAFLTLPVAVPVQATALRGHRRAYRALFLYPPATSLFFSSFFLLFFGFSPGGVSWRHTTLHDVIGLKYLEPSCSAGGRDLVMPLASECLSLRAAAAGDDDLGRHRKW